MLMFACVTLIEEESFVTHCFSTFQTKVPAEQALAYLNLLV